MSEQGKNVESADARVLQGWETYAPWAHLSVQEDIVTARFAGRRQSWSIASWPQVPASETTTGEVLVAANLGLRLRTRMAREGRSHADRHVLHLVSEGALIHLERVGLTDEDGDRPQRATRALPPSGVRAVQAMLTAADVGGPWTVRRLAEEVDLSVGQAHRILSILEQAGLAVIQGTGATASRRVLDRGELLDWLAQQPAARRPPVQWATHLYGRNGREVLKRAADGLVKAGCSYAVSGMAAATLVDLGPTDLPTVHIWVDAEKDLASIAADAGMRRTSRGANVVLWSDVDRSGSPASDQVEGIAIAQGPRIYLDLLQLPRGAEVAETYRRVRLGY